MWMRSCWLAAGMLLAISPGRLAASSVNAYASCGNFGSYDILNVSGTPGQAAVAVAPNSVCAATGIPDYGVLKASAFGQQVSDLAQAHSEFTMNFQLFDSSLPANSQIQVTIPVNYHVILTSNQGSGLSDIGIFKDFDYFTALLALRSTSDQFTNNCPNPLPTLPRCNGEYTGTIYANVTWGVNTTLPNRFQLEMTLRAFGGSTIALNTLSIGNILLPVGTTWNYDVAGNPLNFTTTVDTGVPEVSSFGLAAAGLFALAIRSRKEKQRRDV